MLFVLTNVTVCNGQGNSLSRVVPAQASFYLACPNVRTLRTKLSASGFGKFFGELSEKIEFSTFNERNTKMFKEVVGPTGLSSDELLDALTGKLGYVVMPFADKVGQCVIVEVKEELPAMELLLHSTLISLMPVSRSRHSMPIWVELAHSIVLSGTSEPISA